MCARTSCCLGANASLRSQMRTAKRATAGLILSGGWLVVFGGVAAGQMANDAPATREVPPLAGAAALEGALAAWLTEAQAVAASMQAAIHAGDAAAYLKHVVPAGGALGDTCFRQEQVGLAGDFAKRPVPDFAWTLEAGEVTIREQGITPRDLWPTPAAVNTPTRLELRASMSWTPAGASKPRNLVLPVAFVRADAGAAWLYAGERWQRHVRDAEASTGFAGALVRFAAGDKVLAKEASLIAAQLPRVRREVDEHFGVRVKGVQEVKLYRSKAHLQGSVWLNYTDSLGGWNEPGESIKILVTDSTARRILGIVAHEYGHVASFELGPKATGAPWWALEGCAELASEGFRTDAKAKRDARVAGWLKRGELAPWADITPFPLKPEHARFNAHVYTQGEHLLAFVRDRFGADGYRALLVAMCQGESVEAASEKGLGKPWLEVDALWRAEIQRQVDAAAAKALKKPDMLDPAGVPEKGPMQEGGQ